MMGDLSRIWIALLPLIGLIVGWLLNEFSQSLSIRRARRKPFGRALAHLLQVHQLLHFLELFRHMAEKADSEMAKKILQDAKLNLHTVASTPEEMDRRFLEAIDQIAETAPVLAFELRQKIDIQLIYKKMSAAIGTEHESARNLSEVCGDFTMRLVLPVFEDLLLKTAQHFGSKEYHLISHHFETCRKRLANMPAIPNEVSP